MIWTERTIGGALQRDLFNRAVAVVDNCGWAGNEADLLIVEPKSLRLIDVEIKISRADLKADYHKGKWIDFAGWNKPPRPRRLYPREVWKHYYAVPTDIWTDELLPCLGSPKSGVLLLRTLKDGRVRVDCKKRATPNREAKPLTPSQVIDVARLATLRLWNAYEALRRAQDDTRRIAAMNGSAAEAASNPSNRRP